MQNVQDSFKHRLPFKASSILICLSLISACGLKTNNTNKSEDVNKTSQPQLITKAATHQPPSNSTAMQRVKPLGAVKGNLTPLKQDFYPVEQFSQAIEYAGNMQSYALLVWHKGALRLEHYYNDFDATLKSETASMHKSVLGLLIAAAIEDGFIRNADTRVGDYIQEWHDTPEGDITIRQLLTMSSGLKKLSGEGGFKSESMRFYNGQLNARETILSLRLESKPGTNFTYANTNSQLLALALESATKMPYAQYLSQRLWQPLGADDAAVWYYENTGFPRTFSSLFARARDWAKVGLLIKNNGNYQGKQIISSDSIKQITASSDTNINYGWQIWLGRKAQAKRYYNDTQTGFAIPASEPFAVEDMIYFDGFGGQRVYISEKKDLVIVRIGDSRFDWDDSKLPNMVIETLEK